MDEFLRLARKLAKGDALSVSEDTQLFALRDRLLAEAAKSPLAKEMTEVYRLVDILEDDGAPLDVSGRVALGMALYQAGEHRVELFSAIKCIQRTHYAPAASGILPIQQAPPPKEVN